MFSKKEILVGVIAAILGMLVAWSCRLEATEIKEEVKIIDKYPNFLLYNSTVGCFSGVVQLMILLNPELAQTPAPPAVQQQILAHCSCIMDKIRYKYTIQEYNSRINDFLWVKELWGKFGTECVKEGYLAGLGIAPNGEDNKTIESPEQDSEEEEPLTEDSTQLMNLII